MATQTEAFSPEPHLIKLKGKDYLEVKWRLVWFRQAHPAEEGWGIHTICEEATETSARYRAQILDPEGRIVGESSKTETKSGFADFVEKAETGAIGRALAVCGYGTQFCGDELDEGERIVDSPVARKPAASKRQPAPRRNVIGPTPPAEPVPEGEDYFGGGNDNELAHADAHEFANVGELFAALSDLGYKTTEQRNALRARAGLQGDWPSLSPAGWATIYALAIEETTEEVTA